MATCAAATTCSKTSTRWKSSALRAGATRPCRAARWDRRAASCRRTSSRVRRRAELRADQNDEDSLPPYEILDGILECLVEKEMSFEDVVRQGLRSRDGQAHRASALHLGIQAPPGAAGREDQRAQFRPRPALSDHQCLPGCAGMSGPRPLRAVAHRLAACRQCAHGACSIISSRRRKARNSSCASTTPMPNAPSRNSKRRSSRIWAGSASTHDLFARQIERADAHRAAAEKLKALRPALSRLRNGSRTRPQAQAPDRGAQAAGL